jgi:3-isopropylmalate/(R)-2-methylmalate dehydratase large subunit
MQSVTKTMLDKIWETHTVAELGGNTYLLHVDRHVLHEVSGAISFKGMQAAGRKVACPKLTFATVDHLLDTFKGRTDNPVIPNAHTFIRELRLGCKENNIPLFDVGNSRQGIVHVIAPELGIALPGVTLVCGDSHTCTVGGIGTYGLGVGSTDGETVLASQAVVQTKPKSMRILCNGLLKPGVTAKDLIMFIIGRISARGGEDCAIEFTGPAIARMSVAERLTVCNMAVELSARTGFVPPDDVTYEYLKGLVYSPKGALWEKAVAHWRTLPSDTGATFDFEHEFDCKEISPQVTWGTSPEQVVSIKGAVPDLVDSASPDTIASLQQAYQYMGLAPGARIEGLAVTGAFIGSCTNARLSDIEDAARILKGRKVADGVKAICTPGSEAVKREAEAKGLADVFRDAGFEWREPGCSLCMSGGAGGETFEPFSRIISSTNRNFENRQGRGVRSHLASPATVACSAVCGRISDVRKFVQ